MVVGRDLPASMRSSYSAHMSQEILIADDHPLFRGAMTTIVEGLFPDTQFREATNYAEASKLISEHDFFLAFVDLNMPDSNGLTDLALLKKSSPQTPIIVVSAHESNDIINTCLEFGASGYIVKSASQEEIRSSVEQVLAGELCVPKSYVAIAQEAESSSSRINSLTPSQLKILIEVGKGKLNKQIAYDLSISEATVKAHITSVFRKLGISNRTQAVIFAKEYEASIEKIA